MNIPCTACVVLMTKSDTSPSDFSDCIFQPETSGFVIISLRHFLNFLIGGLQFDEKAASGPHNGIRTFLKGLKYISEHQTSCPVSIWFR